MKWNKFIKELANLTFFWFFGILFFLIFRISFVSIYYKQISVFNFEELSKVLFMGFKFDSTAISYFLIIPLLLLLVVSYYNKFNLIKKCRVFFQFLFVVLSTLICTITINYYAEYHNQFNNFLFLALYDDQKAVLKTVIQDFNPVLNLIFIFACIAVSIFVFKYFENKEFIYNQLKRIHFKGSKYVVVLCTLILFFAGMRGSFSEVTAIRKWSSISKDPFLNKTVINPFRSLKYAYQDFKSVNLSNDKNPFLSKEAFKKEYNTPLVTDILKKQATGLTIEKPKQIFMVIMESYDSWPLMDKYEPFKFSENLHSIAEKGTRFKTFLPASNSTFDSFGAIVTNVPYCGVNISRTEGLSEPFLTSIFTQFKKLGYKTNLFYGGFLSWQNIGGFCKYQGVDKIYSGVDAGGVSDSGDWGIEDEKLFNLVLANTNTNEYSLNIILTSSYHSPYVVDVYKKGFPYSNKEEFPKEMQKYYDEGITFEQMGHLWYRDKAIGDFMKLAEEKYNKGLYCFTGDHFGRRFINHKPNLYERSSVNFIMYGDNIPKSLDPTPGTHTDIMPTLIELIAPKGFEYYSFGESLLNSNENEKFAFQKLVKENEIFYIPKEGKNIKITIDNMKETEINNNTFIYKYNKKMALAWHYIMKGNKIE